MKKLLWVILLILLANLVSASYSIFVKDSLEEGEAKAYETDNGVYIVELMIVSGNSAKFKVNNHISDTLIDGESDILPDKSELIVRKVLESETDQVEFYFFGSGEAPLDIKLDKLWDIDKCDFDSECVNETKHECCYDCGCEDNYICEKNICETKEGSAADEEQDEEPEEECIDDEECDDNDSCTIDSCESRECTYEEKQGCESDDECVDYGTLKEDSYCSQDGWKNQKEVNEECSNDYECLSGSCKKNKCYVKSLRALFVVIVLLIVISLLFFAGKKAKVHKKIENRLFWRF